MYMPHADGAVTHVLRASLSSTRAVVVAARPLRIASPRPRAREMHAPAPRCVVPVWKCRVLVLLLLCRHSVISAYTPHIIIIMIYIYGTRTKNKKIIEI